MGWDIATIVAHSLAVLTGLVALHRHRHFFRQFSVRHLWELRIDALLYVLVVHSTTASLATGLAGALWLVELGADKLGFKWHAICVALHLMISVSMIGFHLITNRLLDNRLVCRLCLRPVETRL